ncbi:MAG TPA: TAT-variant-translocated molybdopterin oxidoreductase [Roseiflexaceae bacterium]|nr:TAT-variant-translocated molybdopterin oxidoreductase [Roseiflexaceae bacterium]
MSNKPLNLEQIREYLADARGRRYWRSLDELAATPEFQEFLHREFPRQASEWIDPSPVSRRNFLKLMGASLALAGLSGCAIVQPQEKIQPYVNKPDPLVPGLPLFYATAMPLSGYATGLLVRSHEGRPTKVEGNPDHPASLGATDVYAQASILGLYDPDRSQSVSSAGQPKTWTDFVAALAGANLGANGGAGLRILTETVTSPTLASQMQTLLQSFPQARWVAYEPAGDNARVGAQQAFGQDVQVIYRFDQANVILSLDANFLQEAAGRVRYARDFIAGRLLREGRTTMNRLYVVESTPTITGAMADNRLPLKASQIDGFARAVAQGVGVASASGAAPAGVPENWIAALVADLQANRGRSLVIAGDGQPPAVHALAYAINAALGNAGATVVYSAPVAASPADQLAGLSQLTQEMAAGQVQALIILGGNPVYTAPADIAFADALKSVPFSAHLSLYLDETSALTTWHIPAAHYLEAWSDARAYDGTASIIQPLIAPLYGGKTAQEMVAALLGQPDAKSYDLVLANWQSQRRIDFQTFWRTALNMGIVEGTAAEVMTLAPSGTLAAAAAPAEGLEISFHLDPAIWDGRFANNGWLQELPKPLTSLTWDNVAMVSPATATQRSLAPVDVVELSYKGRTLRAPVWVQPGQPDDSVAVTLGYGRTRAGLVGNGVGFNANALRTSDAPGFAVGVELSKVGETHQLASTQSHFTMEGRGFVQTATLEEYLQNPGFVHEGESEAHGPQPSLFPDYEYTGNKWGMVIDTNACINCNACVVGCQAENNIPVIGKAEVARSREMHWLKIDQYYSGDNLENPEMLFQPRMCQHCEKAPCEVVCPVAATIHDNEGLNVMVYNRCVGTKYCSNNCPYKVRRFNFFQYSKKDVPILMLAANPEVTVRDRGVMEKCTYCVQRISAARIVADREGRPIADGEVRTACQQACPTNAIVFGNLNDANSQVAKLKAQEDSYGLLGELGTQPRTSYLPRIRNPNPALEDRR